MLSKIQPFCSADNQSMSISHFCQFLNMRQKRNFLMIFSAAKIVYKWPFSNKSNSTTKFSLFKALEFKDYNFQIFVFMILASRKARSNWRLSGRIKPKRHLKNRSDKKHIFMFKHEQSCFCMFSQNFSAFMFCKLLSISDLF